MASGGDPAAVRQSESQISNREYTNAIARAVEAHEARHNTLHPRSARLRYVNDPGAYH